MAIDGLRSSDALIRCETAELVYRRHRHGNGGVQPAALS
jgi:hypothetical protein